MFGWIFETLSNSGQLEDLVASFQSSESEFLAVRMGQERLRDYVTRLFILRFRLDV